MNPTLHWTSPLDDLHPDDAAEAVDRGAEGVIVSNHGGRQVDRAVPVLEMLLEVAERVGADASVLFDSRIRRGADAIVALALGADAILLDRPYVYGLALDGADGVRAVGENFLADLDLTWGWRDSGRSEGWIGRCSGIGRSNAAHRCEGRIRRPADGVRRDTERLLRALPPSQGS